MYKFLDQIQSPADIKKLSMKDLEGLAEDVRQRIIEVVVRNGGHLASNLGVTEVTLALHRVFDFASDRLLWDVGHQCYPHKLITGRHPNFETLRQPGGVSGFPNVAESEYDLFDVGHAGTAIATAVGMARGDQILKRDNRVVALVGDASIVNGVAFEGLNQAGTLKRQFLVVLNDNSMGIAKTQGGLASHFARFRTSSLYEEVKKKIQANLPKVPLVGKPMYEVLEHLKEGFKATVSPHQIFEQLGFVYVGPVDGHDLPHLVEILELLKNVDHPVLLHVHTDKGRGCDFATDDPCKFHSPGKMRKTDGSRVEIIPSKRKSWTNAFAEAMTDLMRADERVYALTAAMPDGTGLAKVQQDLPDRVFDCGIAESCTVDIAAGMAKAGLRPFACIYSTFLQRGFDQVFQEVVLQQLPVTFCMDRAGMVGGDGAVHHGYLDLSYLRSFQNMVVLAPADEPELRQALKFAADLDVPCALRYPRDSVPTPFDEVPFELGKSRTLLEGPDATLLAYGTMTEFALAAADALAGEDIFVSVVNARFCKPIDETMVTNAITRGGPVVTIEDHSVAGGFGSAVLETANRLGLSTDNIVRLGHEENTFYAHGSRGGQLAEAGIDAAGIAAAVRRALGRGTNPTPHEAEAKHRARSGSAK